MPVVLGFCVLLRLLSCKNIDYSDMNDIFSEQKEKLVAINQEISLLRQQVNYLLRNEKPLGLLDLDVLMNRTHTLYDMLCAINLGDNAEDEELDIDPEALAGLFGGMTEEEPEQKETIEEEKPAVEEQTVEIEEIVEPVAEETEPEPEIEPEPEPMIEPEPEIEPEPKEVSEPEPVEEPEPIVEEPMPTEQPAPVEQPAGDEYGFFFRFEDEPVEEEPQPVMEEPVEPVVNQPKEPIITEEGKVVHFVEEVPEEQIPARDLVDGDSIVRENPFDMPRMDDGSDELDFEMAETLGESFMQGDHSLAAKLQQNPVRDLKSVIGINDKFLFVNELFGGSMEKYNKSIENLNDLKTLNGAMIYLNELKIELQWNSSNEAYQKLAELVKRKFEKA